jgi:hypothetical protein
MMICKLKYDIIIAYFQKYARENRKMKKTAAGCFVASCGSRWRS